MPLMEPTKPTEEQGQTSTYEVTFYLSPSGITASVNASPMENPGEDTIPVESLDRAMQILKAVQAEVGGAETESPAEDAGEPIEEGAPAEDPNAEMEQGFNGVRGRGL